MAFAEARPAYPYFWHFDSKEYGRELCGIFMGREQVYGDNSMLHFQLDNGDSVYLWETKLLRAKLAGIPKGTLVMLVWKGVKESKTSPYGYHDYDVFEYVEEDDDFVEVI